MKLTQYKSYDQLPLILSAKDVADVLRISRSGAYALLKRRDFPSFSLGSRLIVPKSAFIEWLESNSSINQ